MFAKARWFIVWILTRGRSLNWPHNEAVQCCYVFPSSCYVHTSKYEAQTSQEFEQVV